MTNVIFSRMEFRATAAFARQLDKEDPLRSWRAQFHQPMGRNVIYFTGNSLGLQPKITRRMLGEELDEWARLGVEGHTRAKHPWMHYYKLSKKTLSKLTGAKPAEVVAMNHLSVNLHLLMISFYRPQGKRIKIIVEGGAFSSDQYIVESQVRFHGYNPDEAIIEVFPREGEFTLRTEDIVSTIKKHADTTALVLFGGIQYYTGQWFDTAAITDAGHDVGALVGFDLAHAIGNVPIKLHKENVDFAAWCSYKYLNSGPGGMAGVFVHERHFNESLPRLAGWWGYDEQKRFQMSKGFVPMDGADGWQLSNYDVLAGAAVLAGLKAFDHAGMPALRKKSLKLTGFLEFLLNQIDPESRSFQIITPANPSERGCQLSVFMKQGGRKVFEYITKAGVVADWREPNVIRVAPAPLYNTFSEVFRFATIFRVALERAYVK